MYNVSSHLENIRRSILFHVQTATLYHKAYFPPELKPPHIGACRLGITPNARCSRYQYQHGDIKKALQTQREPHNVFACIMGI